MGRQNMSCLIQMLHNRKSDAKYCENGPLRAYTDLQCMHQQQKMLYHPTHTTGYQVKHPTTLPSMLHFFKLFFLVQTKGAPLHCARTAHALCATF